MFSQLSRRLAYFFVEKNIIKSEDAEIYAYGYEILFSETVNWIITGIIAIVTGTIAETLVYMLAFMRLRGALGGFHANSHIGCIVISTVVYISCLYIINQTSTNIYWFLISAGLALHMALVFAIAPVAHPNKPFVDKDERLKFRKKSCRLSIVYGMICIIFLLTPSKILKTCSYCILLGMLSASISMMVEYIRQKSHIRGRCNKW
ncbi:MAG: accessory gene regulator ArgB-like protein [Clostridia bacterium]